SSPETKLFPTHRMFAVVFSGISQALVSLLSTSFSSWNLRLFLTSQMQRRKKTGSAQPAIDASPLAPKKEDFKKNSTSSVLTRVLFSDESPFVRRKGSHWGTICFVVL